MLIAINLLRRYAEEAFRRDRGVVLAAVAQNGLALRF